MVSETVVKLEGQLEFKDFLWANYWYLAHKLKLFLGLLFFAGVVYTVLYFAGGFGATGSEAGQSNWGFLFVPALIAFMLLSTYLGARRHFRSNRSLGQRLQFTFSAAGIDATGPLSSGHSSWETLLNAYESRRNFLLFVSTNQMYTIPKRFFSTEEQMVHFRQILKDNLGKRAKIRTGA